MKTYPEYFPFVMTKAMKQDLKELAEKRGQSMASLIRYAIMVMIEKEEERRP